MGMGAGMVESSGCAEVDAPAALPNKAETECIYLSTPYESRRSIEVRIKHNSGGPLTPCLL